MFWKTIYKFGKIYIAWTLMIFVLHPPTYDIFTYLEDFFLDFMRLKEGIKGKQLFRVILSQFWSIILFNYAISTNYTISLKILIKLKVSLY